MEEGITKRESLKRELSGNRRQLENAHAILDVMRYGTDMVATETLARLRLGMDLRDVLDEYSSQFEQRRQSSTSDARNVQLEEYDHDLTGASSWMECDDGKTTTVVTTTTTVNDQGTIQDFGNAAAQATLRFSRPS